MSTIGLTIALLLASPSAAEAPASEALQEAAGQEVIAGEADGFERMTVPVRIGGHGTYRFIIDTGSQRTVLSTELASRLALPSLAKRRVMGIAGSEIAETATVEELGLGRRSFSDLLVVLFEARHIGADGIVGIDSLQQQRVLMDFAANSMTVGDARSLGGDAGFEIVVTARRRSGQLIMTDATVDGVRTAVIIDTGSNMTIGNRALQRALSQRRALPQAELISVTGQRASADIGFARRVGIGDVSITDALIAYTDAPVFTLLELDRRPALMLGMRELRLFRRVAIDFSKRKVFFDLPSGFRPDT